MQKYRLISKKGEGTFSEVLKAQSIKTGKYVAIKCMKNHFESIEQVSCNFLISIVDSMSFLHVFYSKYGLPWSIYLGNLSECVRACVCL